MMEAQKLLQELVDALPVIDKDGVKTDEELKRLAKAYQEAKKYLDKINSPNDDLA